MPDYSMFYQNFTDPMFQSSMMPGTSTSSIQQVPPPTPQTSVLPQRKRRTEQRKILVTFDF